ncbi:MAG: hypothetical protein ACFFDN_45845, partial [Candidatus Hodarchaeota archaeon]
DVIASIPSTHTSAEIHWFPTRKMANCWFQLPAILKNKTLYHKWTCFTAPNFKKPPRLAGQLETWVIGI